MKRLRKPKPARKPKPVLWVVELKSKYGWQPSLFGVRNRKTDANLYRTNWKPTNSRVVAYVRRGR